MNEIQGKPNFFTKEFLDNVICGKRNRCRNKCGFKDDVIYNKMNNLNTIQVRYMILSKL